MVLTYCVSLGSDDYIWKSIFYQKQKVAFPVLFSKEFLNFNVREKTAFNYCILTYGMYDRLYQVMDKNCNMQNNKARPFSCHQTVAHKVNMKCKSIIIVAGDLVASNIFFSCFMGPLLANAASTG